MNWDCPIRRRFRARHFPPIDVSESAGAFYVEADMAGFQKEDIKVTIEKGNEFCISASRDLVPGREPSRIVLSERPFGYFNRCVALRGTIVADSVEVGFSDGVLSAKVPKQDFKSPSNVSIPIA